MRGRQNLVIASPAKQGEAIPKVEIASVLLRFARSFGFWLAMTKRCYSTVSRTAPNH